MEKIMRQPEPDGDVVTAEDKVEAGLVARTETKEAAGIQGRYHVECVRDGKVIWVEEFDNVITTLGKDSMLNVYLDRSTAMTACHMGLKGAGAAAVGDVIAEVAGGGNWSELAIYATRPAVVFGASAAGVKATNPTATAFAINSGTNTVVAGVFLVMSGTNAVANTTGVLFSVGDFASTKTVSSGDTLNVTYTVSLT